MFIQEKATPLTYSFRVPQQFDSTPEGIPVTFMLLTSALPFILSGFIMSVQIVTVGRGHLSHI